MNLGDLRKIVEQTISENDSLRIVTYNNFYNKNQLPSYSRIGYCCCAMGDCEWSNIPREYYDKVLFIVW